MMVKILDDYLNFTNPIIIKYKGQRSGQLNLNLKRLSQIGLFQTHFNILLYCKNVLIYLLYPPIFMIFEFQNKRNN